jgi:D-sedoheptulose 7-phosphate isomerase
MIDSKKAMKIIEKNFSEHQKVVNESLDLSPIITKASEKILDCIKNGGKILICGNGGSAADSNHLAAEFINRYLIERLPLPAISLASNQSNLTSIGNDYSFDLVFSKQVDALGKSGDILIAISTSGLSKNIVEAIKSAKKKSMFSILFTGNAITEASKLSDIAIQVPSPYTPRIQEIHLLLYHCICEIVERELFEK